jgi:hypothetical protein
MTVRPVGDAEANAVDPVGERLHEQNRVLAALKGASVPQTRPEGRLNRLADLFVLDALERDILAVLWTAAYDPALRAALVAREASCGHVTVLLVSGLFGHPLRPRLPSGSPLLLWRLVQEHALVDGGAALSLDPAILAWLGGDHELDRALAGRAQILPLGPELAEWPLDSLASNLRAGLHAGRRTRIRLVTEDRLAARWFAAALGRRIGLPVLGVDAGALATADEAAVRLHRQAFLDGCVPFFAATDADLAAPSGVACYPVQIVHGGGAPLPADPDFDDRDVVPAAPGPAERERLWRMLLPQSAKWPAEKLADLALCHDASIGQIASVAATRPASAAAASLALRDHLRGECGPLTRRIDAAFSWDDLVLRDATRARLEEVTFEARERLRLWAEPAAARLFPYGRGLVALFAGPPGTGKTMAANVIAADLGLDLLAVDLSAVVSKWVGETAQHLQQLLGSRAAQRSVLFFDEADALYAKRVEDVHNANDRFANYDSSVLMTALEAYPGIVILATNLKANIDSAFLRRIRHIVDFHAPDAPARAEIWRKAIAALFPRAQARKLDPQLARVAEIEASGALIKNAALSAAFSARRTGSPPTARLLGEMLARELGKEGVSLSDRDLAAALGEPG